MAFLSWVIIPVNLPLRSHDLMSSVSFVAFGFANKCKIEENTIVSHNPMSFRFMRRTCVPQRLLTKIFYLLTNKLQFRTILRNYYQIEVMQLINIFFIVAFCICWLVAKCFFQTWQKVPDLEIFWIYSSCKQAGYVWKYKSGTISQQT